MRDGLFIGLAVVFQHIFDKVNTPAGGVQLVIQHLVTGAGSRAEPAMDTGA